MVGVGFSQHLLPREEETSGGLPCAWLKQAEGPGR